MTVARQRIVVAITYRRSNKTHWRVGLALSVRVGKNSPHTNMFTTELQLEKKYYKPNPSLKGYTLIFYCCVRDVFLEKKIC